MTSDVLTTRVDDGIAVIPLGSTRRHLFRRGDGDARDFAPRTLDGCPGDANVRVVGRDWRPPGYFIVIIPSMRFPTSRGQAIALCERCQNL